MQEFGILLCRELLVLNPGVRGFRYHIVDALYSPPTMHVDGPRCLLRLLRWKEGYVDTGNTCLTTCLFSWSLNQTHLFIWVQWLVLNYETIYLSSL